MVTMPLGYNTELDQLLKDKKLHFDELYCMKRDDYNGWDQIDLDDALQQDYHRDPCFIGLYADGVQIFVTYSTYLVIGFVRKHRPTHHALSFSANINSGVRS